MVSMAGNQIQSALNGSSKRRGIEINGAQKVGRAAESAQIEQG